MFKPNAETALRDLTQQLQEKFPEVAAELALVKDPKSADAALGRLMQLCMEKPELAAEIQRVTEEALGKFEGVTLGDPQLPVPAYEDALGVKIKPEDLLFRAPNSRLPQLDPMVEAAIAERVQFDGDLPELRSGPLPDGAMPAIPVQTTARNPVAIGRMLRQASEDVREEMRELTFDHEQKLLAAGAQIDEDGVVRNLPAHLQGLPITAIQAPEPDRYKRGQRPAPIAVAAPTATELANLSHEDSQVAAYQALSTTQGRRSAVQVIRDLVEQELARHGFEVRTNDRPDLGLKEVPIYVEWTTQLASGPNSTQPRFSFIDIASKVLSKKLRDRLVDTELRHPVLEVIPINTVDVRRVGWAARLVEGSP